MNDWVMGKASAVYLGTLTWVILFTAGALVATGPHVGSMNEGNLASAAIVLLCHTMPNIAWLCLLGAIIGAHVGENHPTNYQAMGRGILVFFVGLILAQAAPDNPFVDTSQVRYLYWAGLLSGMAYLCTYQDKVFNLLIACLEAILDAALSVLDRMKSRGNQAKLDTEDDSA